MRVAARKLRVEDAAKLQALVVENFDAIEPGLTVLDARLLLGHGTIDVVGIDAAGSLVLCAVGFSANEEMLLKAVEAYSWCLEYPEGLVRLYPSCQLSEERPPRLLFVVERMPDAFQRKIKQLGFPEVDCVEFRHLEFDGVATVYFESLLRLRRSRMVDTDAPTAPPSAAGSATENVITMTGASARALSVKPQKHVAPASPDAAANGTRAADRVTLPREPGPVVSMVSRQATVPAPWVDRPRLAPEPVALREPEPMIVAPVVETFIAAEPEPDVVAAALELSMVPEPVTLPKLPEAPFRPFTVDAVPSMAPAHVTTATAPAGERVSFKDLATALLGATTAAQETLAQVVAAAPQSNGAEPRALGAVSAPIALELVVEPIVAPLELVLESSRVETIETPQPLVKSPALEEIVALAAAALPVEPVAPVIEAPKPPALTLETVAAMPVPAPAAREREGAEPAKPAAPPLPQGFEGLKFPNDGVLTRQWMEFLSQMSASK
jgi:hypothetical protein